MGNQRGRGQGDDDVDELPMGRRVAYWRQRRKMSQQVFADRLGKSKSWVDKVERGVRRLDKFSVLHEIADVLQLDVAVLMGRDPQRKPESINCIDEIEVEEIRNSLERYDLLPRFLDGAPEPVAIPDLRKSVQHAWLTFQHAKYGVMARTLPGLIKAAQDADAAYTNESGREAASLLSQCYQIASSLLRKLGEYELCWLAADRGIAVAQRAGNPLLVGIGTFRVANALLVLGRPRPAVELNVAVAGKLAPQRASDATPAQMSVYGILLLQAVMAAARIADTATVRDLLEEATEVAARLGTDGNHYWTCFGPTNVEFHRAAAMVEMGEGNQAVLTHEKLDPQKFAAMLPERRAHHLLDVARGYAQIGHLDKAGELVLDADRFAPSEIRCRPIAHELVSDVLRRTRGTPAAPLHDLADAMGIAI